MCLNVTLLPTPLFTAGMSLDHGSSPHPHPIQNLTPAPPDSPPKPPPAHLSRKTGSCVHQGAPRPSLGIPPDTHKSPHKSLSLRLSKSPIHQVPPLPQWAHVVRDITRGSVYPLPGTPLVSGKCGMMEMMLVGHTNLSLLFPSCPGAQLTRPSARW
jgi:hypothetical protein